MRTRPELTRPDAQIYFINFSSAQRGGVLHPIRASPARCRRCRSSRAARSHIRSRDRPSAPAIRYNYLATENDRRVMVDGLKFVRRICSDAADARLRRAASFFPATRCKSDEDWLDYCREYGETVFHPTSTCRIGSVVDDAAAA